MVTLLNTVEDKAARDICRDYVDAPDSLLEILHEVQHKHGHLTDGALRTIAQALNISRAEIHGVVSFYHDYKREAGAKLTFKICRAEACQAVGANELIAEAESAFGTKLDASAKDVVLEAAYCLGNCALGPAVLVNDNLYGLVTVAKLKEVAANYKAKAS
jgi:formate dehydrogenase subunit gamma